MIRLLSLAGALLVVTSAAAQPDVAPPPMQAVDRSIDDLSIDILRTEVRLQRLLDAVTGPTDRPGLVVALRSDLGAQYRIVGWRILVDGVEIPIDGRQTLRQSVPPGNHAVDVELVLRGDGLGLFPYVDGYRFTVRSHLNLAFPESAPVRLDVLAHEAGDVTTPFVERPALRIEQR